MDFDKFAVVEGNSWHCQSFNKSSEYKNRTIIAKNRGSYAKYRIINAMKQKLKCPS